MSSQNSVPTEAEEKPYVAAIPVIFALETIMIAVGRRISAIAVASILLIAFANVTEITLRNVFHTSLFGLNEINALLVAIAVSTCLPAGLATGAALTINLLKNRVSKNIQMWLDVFATALMTIFFALAAWRVWAAASTMAKTNQTTIMTSIQKAPFFWGMSIAIGFAALILFVQLLRKTADIVQAGPNRAVSGGIALVLLAAILHPVLALFHIVPTSFYLQFAPDNSLILAAVAFIGMWVLVLLTVPIGVAMGLTGLVGAATLLSSHLSMEVMGSEITDFITRDALSVLPLFLLMGAFATVAGIGADLYRLAHALVGHFRGGLAHASILACAGFGTLTGSSIATQMSIGKIAMVEMRDRKYSPELASGAIAAGGTLGQLIPPSSALILYAVLTEQSVGRLFMGAIIPGILATILYMAATAVWLSLYPKHAKSGPKATWVEVGEAAKGAWSVLLLLSVVLGGIYFGFFTELEAGSVGAAGAFIIALSRGRMTSSNFWDTMASTTMSLALIYSMIFGVTILSFFFGISNLSVAFITFINSLGLSPIGVIFALVLVYLILGTAMDPFATMVITIPIFVPLVHQLGFDPIWWGLMTLICMEAGMISPPFGINIFVISSLDRSIPITTVYRGVMPYFFSTLVKIALLMAFPILVTWLPSTMG